MFGSVSEKILNRPGGYTRIIKLGKRLGDAAEICFIELVDFNDVYNTENEVKKTRRSRRGGKSNKQSDNKKTNTSKVQETQVAEDVKAAEEAPAEKTS